MSYFLLTLLLLVGLFLIAVILLQRGRGGGLAGAFGGLGGQSAFGTRAGDTFTWITVVTVLLWVLLAGLTGRSMYSDSQVFVGRDSDEVDVSPDPDKKDASRQTTPSDKGPEFEDIPVGEKPESGAGKPGETPQDAAPEGGEGEPESSATPPTAP